jgi:hypothetical protein
MAKVIVFYEGKLYGEYDEWPKFLPYGAIIREKLGHHWGNKSAFWYRVITVSHTSPINLSDIPAEIKMLCLVLNIPL